MYFEVKKSFKRESLTFVGFYPTDFRPVSVVDAQEEGFFFFFFLSVHCDTRPSEGGNKKHSSV